LNLSVGYVANASAIGGHACDVKALGFTSHGAGRDESGAIEGLVS
jgi:hypothetical protein